MSNLYTWIFVFINLQFFVYQIYVQYKLIIKCYSCVFVTCNIITISCTILLYYSKLYNNSNRSFPSTSHFFGCLIYCGFWYKLSEFYLLIKSVHYVYKGKCRQDLLDFYNSNLANLTPGLCSSSWSWCRAIMFRNISPPALPQSHSFTPSINTALWYHVVRLLHNSYREIRHINNNNNNNKNCLKSNIQ